jgi:His/Glu/Gln/Arg/opine family amino acid ABC transporter permease subunit
MSVLASFDWSAIWDNRGLLAEGLWRTIQVSVIGIVLATAIGLVLGAIRAYRIPVLSQLAGVYVEIIRNTPLLVQIIFLFYALPTIHAIHLGVADIHVGKTLTTLSPYATACVAVVIWGGAFNTENFRAGFEAVPFRYREAAAALGFGRIATFFRVTFPIGSRIALPSTINTHISVLKNTSLMTAIGFQELTTTSRSISAQNFRDVEMLSTIAVTYLAVVWTLSGLVRLLERHLAIPESR